MTVSYDLIALQKLYTQYERIQAADTGYRVEITPTVIRHIDPQQQHSFLIYSNLSTENADQTIEEQLAYFNHPFEWKWYDYDQPSDLLERLERHGFQVGEEEVLMVLPIPDTLPTVSLPEGFTMQAVTDANQLVEVLNTVQNPVFESEADNWINVALTDELHSNPNGFLFWAVYDHDQPISAAWLRLSKHSPFGSLWGGATLSEYRGRGVYTALIAQRMLVAHQRGKLYLTVDASPMSRPILQRRGFIPLALTRECIYPVEPSLKS